MKIPYFTTLLFLFISSCNEFSESPIETHYNDKANELISQIFSDENYDNSYFIKPNYTNLIELYKIERPGHKLNELLEKHLNLSEDFTIDSIIKLSNNFEFDDTLSDFNTKLISYREFDSITKVMDSVFHYGTEKDYELYIQNNQTTIYTISKPVFDKNFKTALIQIDMTFTCISFGPSIYRLKNGKWISELE